MFGFRKLKNSYIASAKERALFEQLLQQYAATSDGAWVKELPGFGIYWCKSMNTANGVLGAFSIFHGNNVFLMPRENGNNEFWQVQIFPTLVHELKHLHQFRSNPVLYVICALPGLREAMLEPEAREQEKLAEKFMGADYGDSV